MAVESCVWLKLHTWFESTIGCRASSDLSVPPADAVMVVVAETAAAVAEGGIDTVKGCEWQKLLNAWRRDRYGCVCDSRHSPLVCSGV